MPPERPSAWLPAIVVAALVTVAIGLAGYFLLETGLRRSTPTLEEATRTGASAVGQAVAGQFAHALDLGIPLDKLPGIEPYLKRIVASSPQVDGLALLGDNGQTLSSTGTRVDGERFPIVGGDTRATLVVAAESPLIDRAVRQIRFALAVAAVLTGAVAGGIVFCFIAFNQSPAYLGFLHAMRRVTAGDFTANAPGEDRGRLSEAAYALRRRMDKVKTARLHLIEAVATIRAIDFDGSLGRRVDSILRPLEEKYAFADSEEEEEALAEAPSRGEGLLWRVAVALGLYAAAFPFVANFAFDREAELIPVAWSPILPLLAELAAACIGAWLGSGRAGATRASLAFGTVVLGLSLAVTYWCRSYETFVLLRACAGFSIGLVAAGLLAARKLDLKQWDFSAVLVFSTLFAAPLLAGLLSEAIGRRVAFLIIGAAVLVLAPFLAAGGRRVGKASTRLAGLSRPHLADLLFGLAILPAAAMMLVEIPMGMGFEDYLLGSIATATLAVCVLVAPAMPPLGCGMAILAAALALYFPLPFPPASMFVACAALGLGAGGAIKALGQVVSHPWAICGAGTGAALLAMGAAGTFHLPFAAIVAGVSVIVMGAGFVGRPRAENSPA